MTRSESLAFARHWADLWNARDVDLVLAHFASHVVFSSPKALQVVGTPTVHGTASLREYWLKALSQVQSLHFSIVRVLWDEAASELSIIYDRDLDGRRDRAAEVLHFDASGLVDRGEVFYGVAPAGAVGR